MGDDCAVLDGLNSPSQLLTTDSVTYGQHFNDSVPPVDAGSKLIKRNLSDIAAMGGEPGPALLNLLMGPDLDIEWLEPFIRGIRNSCVQYGVQIVGGDVSQLAPGQFTAALTLTGTMKRAPLLRSGASLGDSIYVTGTLGGSILQKHYAFEPRLAEGQWLAKQSTVTAMMDLTDGLGKDLAALLPHGTSAAIHIDQLPISEAARTCSRQDGQSAEAHAFCDGEDYELVFTLTNQTDCHEFESAWRTHFSELKLSRIGKIMVAHPAGRYIDAASNQVLLWTQGFEHFHQA